MSTGRKVASIAFTGAAAAATVGYGLTPALAATTWHIKNGTVGYHGKVEGANKGTTKLVDKTHAVTLTCKKASVSGSVPKSSVAATGSSTQLGTLKVANFASCSFLGVTFTAKLNKAGKIFAHSYASGVTHGFIREVSAELSGVNITGCKAKVTGKLPMIFRNDGHAFVVDSKGAADLKIASATTACPEIAAGDKAYFKGTFPVKKPSALTVSS
jgi:hypothetical protein